MRTRLLVVGSCLVVGFVVLGVRPALAQAGCPNVVPWPLVTLCADSAARASDVNGNFTAVMNLLAARTGAIDAGVSFPPSTVSSTTIVDGTIQAGDLAGSSVTSATILDGTIDEADLNALLRCPDNSRATYGQCLFYRGPYVYTLRQAAAQCVSAGARLCTLAETQAAYAAGYSSCGYGWVADGASPSTGTTAIVNQVASGSCGSAGVGVQSGVNVNSNSGAYCCK